MTNKIYKINKIENIFKSNPDKYFSKKDIMCILGGKKNLSHINQLIVKLHKLGWIIRKKEILYNYDNNIRVKPFCRYIFKCNYFQSWNNLNYLYDIANKNGKIYRQR